MVAKRWDIRNPYPGYLPTLFLVDLKPELPNLRLGFCIGEPGLTAVLILTDDLTIETPVALVDINYKDLHVSALRDPD
jgi:hypothetical protein